MNHSNKQIARNSWIVKDVRFTDNQIQYLVDMKLKHKEKWLRPKSIYSANSIANFWRDHAKAFGRLREDDENETNSTISSDQVDNLKDTEETADNKQQTINPEPKKEEITDIVGEKRVDAGQTERSAQILGVIKNSEPIQIAVRFENSSDISIVPSMDLIKICPYQLSKFYEQFILFDEKVDDNLGM